MLLLPPRPTLTATLFPYPTLVRSHPDRAFPPHGSPAAAPFPPLPSEWGRTALPPALSAAAARAGGAPESRGRPPIRSEEHTSELQSLMRISYAVFCLKKKKNKKVQKKDNNKISITTAKHYTFIFITIVQ